MHELAPDLRLDRPLDEREVVGAGWLASERETGRQVVVRAVRRPMLAAAVLDRFERDLRRLKAMQHPGVASVLQHRTSGEWLTWIRPFVPGVTLARALRDRPLGTEETLQLGAALARALDHLHRAGIAHRNLSPAAIIVGPDRRPVLVEVGLGLVDTHAFTVNGLPGDAVRFVSPEQSGLVSAHVDGRADLFALGAILFEAATSIRLFDGTSVGDVLRQQLRGSELRLATTGALPRALQEVLSRLTRQDPAHRYQRASAVARDLEAIAAALARGAPPSSFVVGTHDRRTSVVEAGFVGRRGELDALENAVAASARGPAAVAIVEAESGAGKTRLLDELVRRVVARDARVIHVQGRRGPTQKPFELLDAVVDEVLRAARSDPTLRARLTSTAPEDQEAALEVFPQLGTVLGPAPRPSAGSEGARQLRSARAMGALLGSLGSAEHPAVLVLDDAQGSDDFTATALTALRERGQHTAVVVAFSFDAVPQDHSLRAIPADLHLEIPPLSDEEIRELAGSMAGVLPEQALHLVTQLSGGNAFMASAVVRGLVESGALVPQPGGWRLESEALSQARFSGDAAALLSARLLLLPADTLDLLKVGAVLGSSFSVHTAATLAGVEEPRANEAMEDARRRHLLWRPSAPGTWTFVHERIREVLLGSLPTERRRALHARVAQTLSNTPSPPAFELAYHFSEAGDAAAAFPWALQAARSARTRHAVAVAESHFRIAASGSDAAPAETRGKLAEEWGETLMLLGRYPEAVAQMERARSLADGRMDQARIDGLLGELAFKQGDSGAAAEALERALKRLDRQIPKRAVTVWCFALWEIWVQVLHSLFPRVFLGTRGEASELVRLSARLYSRLAYIYFFDGGRTACLWAQLRETNLAERYAPTPELAQAWSEHAPALSMVPLYRRALRYAERSLQLRRSFNDAWGEGQTLHFYGVTLYAASRFADCIERCRHAMHLLDRTGDRWEVNIAHANLGLSLFRLGRLEEARWEAERLVAAARQIGDSQSVRHGLGVWIKAGGEVPPALFAEELERPGQDAQSLAVLLEAQGLHHLQQGELQGAVASLKEANAVARRARLRQEYVASILPNLATALRRCVELQSPYQRTRAAGIIRQASRVARRAVRTARLFRNNLAHASREMALMAALRGRPGAARRWIEQSVATARSLEMSHELALSLDARRRLARTWDWDVAEEPTADDVLNDASMGVRDAKPTLSIIDRFPRVLEAGRRIAVTLTRQEVFVSLTDAARSVFRTERVDVVELAAPGPVGPLADVVSKAIDAGRVTTAEEAAHTVVCAPVFERGHASAALVVVLPVSRTAVGEDEERVAGFLAALAGAALENAAGFARIEALSQERARLYEQAQDALHARDEFLEVASHELKTPLTALKLRLDAVLRVASSSDPAAPTDREAIARSVTLAREHANRLARLIHHLLDASSGGGNPPLLTREGVDLSQVVRDVVERTRHDCARAGCQVRLRTPGPVEGVWDDTQLGELVQHLVANALKYGAGAPIDIELSEDAHTARVQVRDRGIGISKEAQERIFQRFERAVSVEHYGGFGLGLWNARNIAEAHGGALTVESVEGAGATFTLTLPRDGAHRLH